MRAPRSSRNTFLTSSWPASVLPMRMNGTGPLVGVYVRIGGRAAYACRLPVPDPAVKAHFDAGRRA
jgi:hypothetical protein